MVKRISKRKIIILFSSITIASLLALSVMIFLSKRNGKIIIAKVNDEKIYYHELETKLNEVLDSGQNNNNFKVENLPQEALIILAKEIYLEKAINKKIKKANVSNIEEIEQKVENYKNILLRRAFLDDLIKKDVNEEMVKAKYMELVTQMAGKKEYLLEQILLRRENDAKLVSKKLKENPSDKNFIQMIKKYSIDLSSLRNKDLYILEDNLVPQVAEFVIDGKKDEISEPIKSDRGWHIIKIKDFRDAKAMEYNEIKEDLAAQLKKEAVEKFYFGIVKDAKIKILIKTKGDFAAQELLRKKQNEALKNAE